MQPASMKAEMVRAPPSMRMRRWPRSASACTIAAGGIGPALGFEQDALRPIAGPGVEQQVTQVAQDAVIGEPVPGIGDTAARIDDDTGRTSAGNAPHREAGVIDRDRGCADHDRVHIGAQPMQMVERRVAVDIA